MTRASYRFIDRASWRAIAEIVNREWRCDPGELWELFTIGAASNLHSPRVLADGVADAMRRCRFEAAFLDDSGTVNSFR